jgi:hypothetical protein
VSISSAVAPRSADSIDSAYCRRETSISKRNFLREARLSTDVWGGLLASVLAFYEYPLHNIVIYQYFI